MGETQTYAIFRGDENKIKQGEYPFSELEQRLNTVCGKYEWVFLIRGKYFTSVIFNNSEKAVLAKMFIEGLEDTGEKELEEILSLVREYY